MRGEHLCTLTLPHPTPTPPEKVSSPRTLWEGVGREGGEGTELKHPMVKALLSSDFATIKTHLL
jgi:hypothetical protein